MLLLPKREQRRALGAQQAVPGGEGRHSGLLPRRAGREQHPRPESGSEHNQAGEACVTRRSLSGA